MKKSTLQRNKIIITTNENKRQKKREACYPKDNAEKDKKGRLLGMLKKRVLFIAKKPRKIQLTGVKAGG